MLPFYKYNPYFALHPGDSFQFGSERSPRFFLLLPPIIPEDAAPWAAADAFLHDPPSTEAADEREASRRILADNLDCTWDDRAMLHRTNWDDAVVDILPGVVVGDNSRMVEDRMKRAIHSFVVSEETLRYRRYSDSARTCSEAEDDSYYYYGWDRDASAETLKYSSD